MIQPLPWPQTCEPTPRVGAQLMFIQLLLLGVMAAPALVAHETLSMSEVRQKCLSFDDPPYDTMLVM